MKKLLSITLALIMCICAMAVDFTAGAADGENILAGVSYEYQVGEFFSSFTDNEGTLLTNGEYRGDGENSFNTIYAVSGVSVELRGDRENGSDMDARRIDNVIVFDFEGTVTIDYLVFRGVRRIGNRYTNIVSIETSSNGTDYTSIEFTEQAEAISGAPQLNGSNQFFDITANFNTTATKVRYLKVVLNTLDLSGSLQYLVQLDEVEAYGSVTGKYVPAAEVSVSANKNTVRPGEYITVTVLVNNITSPNGIVGCDLPLTYDNSVLRLTRCAGIFPSSWNGTGKVFGDATLAGSPYWMRLVCDADDLAANADYNVKESGVLGFSLTFKAIAEGNATITVDNVPDEGIFMMVVNGASFDNYGATGASVSVNVSGEAIAVEKGDVNEDGSVDNLDAVMVLRYDAGTIELNETARSRGDLNGDGMIDNLDATIILKYDAGLIPDL